MLTTTKRSVIWDFALEWGPGDEPWPSMTKKYGQRLFQPTRVNWSVTDGKLGKCSVSGCRILKTGAPGEYMTEVFFYQKDIPLWIWSLIDQTMEEVDLA